MLRQLNRALAAALMLGLLATPIAAASAVTPTGAASTTSGNTAAALSTAKVVIIVGPTGSATSNYRSIADSAYAEAIKWSSNVVRLYSPNATWAAVKPAMQGASIVVYLGHGNGWPAPYPYDPTFSSKDGLGLNATANAGDANTAYYGEPYLANEVALAPNAVVLLNHLCYASGNSEPQNPDPTLDVAMQRVDNFGQGFIKAGARAVIAEGHGSINGMIRDLFSTHQTLLNLWRTQYDYHGNEFSFQSSRNPAYTAFMDPDSPAGGYYRSLIGNPGIRTEDVTGVAYAPTDVDPPALVAPGAAQAGTSGAALSPNADMSAPSGTLAAGTVVRVDQISSATSSAHLKTLGGAALGWAATGDLIPRDSTPPATWGLAAGPPRITSGQTSFAFTASLSEASTWTVAIAGGSGTVAQATGTDKTPTLTWDGRVGGVAVASGTYTWTLDATDQYGNTMTTSSGTFRVWDGLGTRYQPVSPARVLDTRFGTGLAGPFSSTVPRTFQVAGIAGIPSDAVAVTGNLTIVGQTSNGYVCLTPTPTVMPATSTITAPRGDTRANGVTVPLSDSGTLSAVFRGASGATSGLIFDVTGYYAPSSGGSTYVPLDPTRLLDTRFGTGLVGSFTTAVPRTLAIAGQGPVPAGALAISGNVTVTNQSSAGWVAITPLAQIMPATSTLNFPAGDNRANNFTLPLASDGSIAAVFRGTAGATADLIIDVTGYFVAGTAGAEYIPITPTRALDTRFGTGLPGAFTANTSRTFAVGSASGVPGAAVGVTGNVTVVGPSYAGYATVTPTPDNTPATSTINVPGRDIRANGVNMRLSAGSLSTVFRSAPGATTDLIFDVTGYFVPAR